MPDAKLSGRRVLMVIPPTQFRDEEFFEPKTILEMQGAKIVVASTAVRTCRGMQGASVNSEIAIAEAKAEDYDALIISGGSSVPEFLWNDKKLHELAATMTATGKVVAAICLATVVLAKAKLLAGRNATVYFLPQAIQEIRAAGANYVKETLLVEGKLILAEGPPESQRFGQAIVTALTT
jgi:protease I